MFCCVVNFANSRKSAVLPFIFQLPAASFLRIALSFRRVRNRPSIEVTAALGLRRVEPIWEGAMIPRIDAALLVRGDTGSLEALRDAATGVGFATVFNTTISAGQVHEVLDTYRQFFKSAHADKEALDMARTGANRGWGAAGSEQVDPDANPDFKQFFDVGFELPVGHPLSDKTVYAPNQWPKNDRFRAVISDYYAAACDVSFDVLRAIARCLGADAGYFDAAFQMPMALLRGNFYPSRPAWATERDFGIATHTDYGCLTLLATGVFWFGSTQARRRLDSAFGPARRICDQLWRDAGILDKWSGQSHPAPGCRRRC